MELHVLQHVFFCLRQYVLYINCFQILFILLILSVVIAV